MPLQIGKTPIVVPRQHQYNEHVNDHQVEFARNVAQRMGTIIPVEDINTLGDVIMNYDQIVAGISKKIWTSLQRKKEAGYAVGNDAQITEKLLKNFRKERNDWKLDLRVGDGADAIELEIFAEPNPPKRVNRPEACGLRHLAFRVDDVEATVAELAQMGIECEPIRLDSYTKKKMTFFFDPDGLPLELHE